MVWTDTGKAFRKKQAAAEAKESKAAEAKDSKAAAAVTKDSNAKVRVTRDELENLKKFVSHKIGQLPEVGACFTACSQLSDMQRCKRIVPHARAALGGALPRFPGAHAYILL